MTLMQILFLLVSAVTLISAGIMVSTRRMIHAALWFVLTLMGVAVLFAMLEAGFFAVVQVMVYIGAISILFIFAVMLTRKAMEDTGAQVNPNWWVVAVISVAAFAGLVGVMSTWSGFQTALAALPTQGENLVAFGNDLVSPNGSVLIFELSSILLLAGLIGAIYVGVETKAGGRK
jgi:NADH-quinone oxidoreductase subunit J